MKSFLVFLLLCLAFFSCENPGLKIKSTENKNDEIIDYGTVFFFNESSYSIIIHKDAFSGPIIAELNSGESKNVKLSTSNNYGIGTTFSIEFKTNVIDELAPFCGDVFVYGIDPNMQLNINIEKDKKYSLQIPQPSNLVFKTAFLKIINASAQPFELMKYSTAYKQAGNGILSVPSGEIGIYEIPSSSVGLAFENYTVKAVFNSYDIPSFSAYYGKIYNFIFDGAVVRKISEESFSY